MIAIRQAVARNPRTPIDILEKLAHDPACRRQLAQNPNTPTRILRFLSQEPELQVVLAVASNEATDPMTLRDLARHYCKEIAEAARGSIKRKAS
jgi:hypothetical protein